jgi:flagellar biogenesis protein FliO
LLFCFLASCTVAASVSAEDPILQYRGDDSSQPASIPLKPRGAPSKETRSSEAAGKTTTQTLTTIVGGLAVCLGAFFLFAWVSRRHAPSGTAPLPKEVLESLGRIPFNGRQSLQLVRLGRKLVLLHVSATSTATLTEITDPAEVDHLVGLCQQSRPSSVTASFQDVLKHYENEPAPRGFLGDARQSDWELAEHGGRGRLARQENRDE